MNTETKYCLFNPDLFQIADLPYGSKEEMEILLNEWAGEKLEVMEVI